MENNTNKYAALCMLIRLVDENSGCLEVNSDKVKKVFNDENDYVKIEYSDGSIGLAADAEFETMDSAIHRWRADNQEKYSKIAQEFFSRK